MKTKKVELIVGINNHTGSAGRRVRQDRHYRKSTEKLIWMKSQFYFPKLADWISAILFLSTEFEQAKWLILHLSRVVVKVILLVNNEITLEKRYPHCDLGARYDGGKEISIEPGRSSENSILPKSFKVIIMSDSMKQYHKLVLLSKISMTFPVL